MIKLAIKDIISKYYPQRDETVDEFYIDKLMLSVTGQDIRWYQLITPQIGYALGLCMVLYTTVMLGVFMGEQSALIGLVDNGVMSQNMQLGLF